MNESKISNRQEHKNRNKLTKKTKIIIISSFCLLLLAFITSVIISNTCLKITHHSLDSTKVNSSIRIALISDLHGKKFGKNNYRLIKKIASDNPDLILMTGDIFSRDNTEQEYFAAIGNLVESLSELAPTYYSLGNHEHTNPELEKIKATVTAAGAVILDDNYTDITVNNTPVRLGGISYYRYWEEAPNDYLADFTNVSDDVFTLLLCHNPEFYLWGIKNYPIDLVASGHTHGGIVKLPLLGPLYAPEQGWFPDYAAGFYEFENGHLAVTTGLGSSPGYLPRVFNRPEIMIIDVK